MSALLEPNGRVALVAHPYIPTAQALAGQLAECVRQAGFDAWVATEWGAKRTEDAPPPELIVTLGGDGTILRAVRETLIRRDDGILRTPPILAVNFGTLGFLAELEPEQACSSLTTLLHGGDYWIEERHLLLSELEREGEIVERLNALNEIVLTRGDRPHAIRLWLDVDGVECAHYVADALIVASPTGSTAYALGAGGLILPPAMDALLAVPVAPHLSVTRGFVLPGSSHLTLRATSHQSKVVTIDGQITLPYENRDQLRVTRSDSVARFVRLGPRDYFYRTVQQKLRRP